MADRQKNPTRYYSINAKLEHRETSDVTVSLLVTYGLDSNNKVRAVFCSSFRAGSSLNVLAMDGCKLMSLLLQHGYDAGDIVDKLDSETPSILGTLARGAVETEKANGS